MCNFPVDIWSVKEYGVEKWYTECSIWPISDQEFTILNHEIDDLFMETISRSSSEVSDGLWILYKLVVEYTMFLHALIVMKRLQDDGVSILYDRNSLSAGFYRGLIEEEGNFRGLFYRDSPRWPQIPKLRQRVRGYINALLLNVKCGRFSNVSCYFGLSKRPSFLALFYPGNMLERYAKADGKNIWYVYPYPIITKNNSRNAQILPEIEQRTGQLIGGLQKIASKHGVELPNGLRKYLREMTKALMSDTLDSVSEMRKVLRQREATSILASGLGATLTRSLCVAGRKEGYKVVGYLHGNSVGMFNNSVFARNDLSMADIYLVPTEGSKSLIANAVEKYQPSLSHPVQVVSSDSNIYENLWDRNKQMSLPKSIEKVMFLEYPITEFRHAGTGLFWFHQLHLTLDLAHAVRGLGLKAILKRHPDRLQESEGIYSPYFDQLLTQPFETVYQQGDAYLFTNIASTTFGFALLTNRPVIIFEYSLQDLWEEVRAPLSKRCRVIPSWFDQDGKLDFDHDALADALRRKPEEPDAEFVRKYMLSAD